jgi:putative serine protease PepD
VIDHEMAPTPPAHPPLAPTTTPHGLLQPSSPPTYDPGPSSPPEWAVPPPGPAPGARSRATAGLPPLPTVARAAPGRGLPRPSPPVLAALAGVLVVVLVAAVVFGFGLVGGSSPTRRPRAAAKPTPLDAPALRRAVAPSVAALTVTRPDASGTTSTVAGSAVVVTSSGVLVTTADLVAGASGVQVVLSNGQTLTGVVAGTLPGDDVALVQVSGAGDLRPAPRGRSAGVHRGDEVVAVGAPTEARGLPSSSEGLVTATGRDLPDGAASLHDLIQTDAPIAAQATGGPLVDAHGQVIGLNVLVAGQGPTSGFALAIDAVQPLITQIEQGHALDTPNAPTLGVSTADVSALSPAAAARYKVETSDGALVVRVSQPSAAASAGLVAGDVITAIDAQPVNDGADVTAAVAGHQAGDQIQVTFERGGTILHATVTLLARRDTGS